MSNGYYVPTCEADCDNIVLPDFSNPCASEDTIELGELEDLFLSEKSTTAGVPKNPITGWVSAGLAADPTINEAAINTWYGTVDNGAVDSLRHLEGIGEKPEPTSVTVDLAKGKKIDVSTTQTTTFVFNVMDNARYEAFRKIQKCKGEYHAWYTTNSALYGGINGIIINIEKAYFTYSGKTPKTFTIVFTWVDASDPPRDAKPFN